jgi:PRTRC genetic system protein C
MAVRNFYASAGYSELASAAVVGPAIVGTTATYEIQRTVRDKG